MKFSIALPFWLLSVVTGYTQVKDEAATGVVHHRPHKISFDALLKNQDSSFHEPSNADMTSLLHALSEYGIISITDIPGYQESKENTFKYLHACAIESNATREHSFHDGTVRLTMATRTVPGPGGQQEIKHSLVNSSPSSTTAACSMFSESSENLRHHVQRAALAFAARLGSALNTTIPLLTTKDNEYEFDTFENVVENGEHLEHFHSYRRTATDAKSSGNDNDTIDMHTDQGIFIAFAPAVIVDASTSSSSITSKTSLSKGDLYINLKDGSRAVVNFDEGDLVIMLGDGVNQFINPKVVDENASSSSRVLRLRATPHALDMSHHNTDQARVWYGRMILPPADAIHPDHGETFGHLRQLMIDATLSNDEESLDLGCSDDGVIARQLEDVVCADDSLFCWSRCMAHADHNVSEAICRERNLKLQCINPRDQVAEGGVHGDYYPACSNTTDEVTDYPTLSDYPRDDTHCDEKAWVEFSSSQEYNFVFENLGNSSTGNVSKFMWNVVDGNTIDAKLVFNGIFGWLSAGFQNEGGKHNGMNGASVIMAVPGGNYSAALGLDLSEGNTVEEYVIDPNGSSFRHWSDPLPGRDVSSYKVVSTDCFTALSFKTDNINDIKFNVTGADNMMWAGNGKDYFMGYHGRSRENDAGGRDVFVVEWSTGKAWIPVAEDDENVMPSTESSSSLGMNTLMANIVMIGVAVVGMM